MYKKPERCAEKLETIKKHVFEDKNEAISLFFDQNYSVTTENMHGHNGVDIIPKVNVITPESGIVTYVKDFVYDKDTSGDNDFGNNIKINIDNKYIIRFCHLAHGSIKVKVGDKVKSGEVIGVMGKTGFTDNNHLHFGLYEIIEGFEIAIDPLPYLEGCLLLTGFDNRRNPYELIKPVYSLNPFNIKRLDKVRINAGAKDYYGKNIEPTQYSRIHNVLLIDDNGRAIVGREGGFTVIISAQYLTRI